MVRTSPTEVQSRTSNPISTSGTPEKAALFDWNVPLSVVLVDAKR